MLRKKICLLGAFSVGKTSLIRRFVDDRFDDRYLSTIGAKVSRTIVALDAAERATMDLLIWDLAGSEPFDGLMRSYYAGAAGAILVCDLTRPETADPLAHYAQQFWSVNPQAPLALLGNKADLAEPGMLSEADLAILAASLSAPALRTSAKTGMNVQEAFRLLAQRLVLQPT
jgi:small GTP-binding protein